MQKAEARTDWFQVIIDLSWRGIVLQKISGSIGVPKSTILGWKQGAEPKHGEGEKMISLWCRVMDRPREALPKVRADAWNYH